MTKLPTISDGGECHQETQEILEKSIAEESSQKLSGRSGNDSLEVTCKPSHEG